MDMNIDDMPGCCTAKVFCNFWPALGESPEQFANDMIDALTEQKQRGNKMVIAITIPEQKTVITALKMIGFENDDPIKGGTQARNKNRPLTLWSYDLGKRIPAKFKVAK